MTQKPLLRACAAIAFALLPVLPAHADKSIPEPLLDYLFPPELLVQCGKTIGISAEQEQAMRADVAAFEPEAKIAKEKLTKATDALVESLKYPKPDSAAALKAADAALSAEREVKLGQLALLIKLKSALTPDQQTQLRDLRNKMGSIKDKYSEVMELVENWKQQGRDLSAFAPLKEEATAAKEKGDYDSVERILDEAIRKLKAE